MRRGLVTSVARGLLQTVGIIVLVVVALPFLPVEVMHSEQASR